MLLDSEMFYNSACASGFGHGKVILFGEHFVVHGLPAIVAALQHKTVAHVSLAAEKKGIEFQDCRPKAPSFTGAKVTEYGQMVRRIVACAGITKPMNIVLDGDLPVFSGGIGSSAACAAAIARALNNFGNLGWDEQTINSVAFEGEKAVHGTPSGIDNTAAVFGGAFLFKKSGIATESFQPFSFQQPVEVVLADSGLQAHTKNVLHDINALRVRQPTLVRQLFDEYQVLIVQALHALHVFDLGMVGMLMNQNHALLQKLTVSSTVLDEMVILARQAGSLGAKLTGTGRGGLIVALTPGVALQEKVANQLSRHGFTVFKTTVG